MPAPRTSRTPARELTVWIPPADDRQARVTIAVVEDDPADQIAPTTMREPGVAEMDDIATALLVRHYNLRPQDG